MPIGIGKVQVFDQERWRFGAWRRRDCNVEITEQHGRILNIN
jgi:hypothetical protein